MLEEKMRRKHANIMVSTDKTIIRLIWGINLMKLAEKNSTTNVGLNSCSEKEFYIGLQEIILAGQRMTSARHIDF